MKPMIRRNDYQSWLPSIFSDFFDNDWMVKPNATAPAINVSESDTEYKVEVAAPGMKKEDFSIHVSDDDRLVITMEKKNEVKDEQRKYLRREFSYSKFQQSMILPDDAEKDKISAAVKDGVLMIDVPKKTRKEETKENRIIEIQ